jgi:hypothetical protein
MEQIAPYPDMFILPEGSKLTVYAADQAHLGYEPLPSIKTPDGKVVSQWKPTQEELKRLFDGEPLTLIVWTFNQKLQPVCLGVGGFDLT